MTTFLAQNYETLAGTKENSEDKKEETPEGSVEKAEEASGLSEIKVTLTGPISEIVANALNAVFKNPDAIEISKESRTDKGTHVVSFSTESVGISNDITVYCIGLEHISEDPVKHMAIVKALTFENNRKVFVYVETNKQPVTRTKESWFIENASTKATGSFFSQESLIRYIRGIS